MRQRGKSEATGKERGVPVKTWNIVNSDLWKVPKYSGALVLNTFVAIIAYTEEMINN